MKHIQSHFMTRNRWDVISEKQKNESGRSMVEMLGVLAVIGVLSITGVAGFNHAIDKNRTNTLIEEAQKRAALIVPQVTIQENKNPTLDEFTNNDLGFAKFDTVVYTSENSNRMPPKQFGIKLTNVSKSICKNVMNTIGDKTPIRKITTTTPSTPLTSCGANNTFLLIYNNDMGTTDPSFEDQMSNCLDHLVKYVNATDEAEAKVYEYHVLVDNLENEHAANMAEIEVAHDQERHDIEVYAQDMAAKLPAMRDEKLARAEERTEASNRYLAMATDYKERRDIARELFEKYIREFNEAGCPSSNDEHCPDLQAKIDYNQAELESCQLKYLENYELYQVALAEREMYVQQAAHYDEQLQNLPERIRQLVENADNKYKKRVEAEETRFGPLYDEAMNHLAESQQNLAENQLYRDDTNAYCHELDAQPH